MLKGLIAGANAFLIAIGHFSLRYWFIGTPANFTAELSKIDALYFTLDTLTTAGTGLHHELEQHCCPSCRLG